MKWITFMGITVCLFITVIASDFVIQTDAEKGNLFHAIAVVETNCNPDAVGDGGRSRGMYQISKPYWQDATEYGKVNWNYETNVYDNEKCKQVMTWYWARYGAKTNEEKARMHNGGPDGHLQSCTIPYWKKVKEHLND